MTSQRWNVGTVQMLVVLKEKKKPINLLQTERLMGFYEKWGVPQGEKRVGRRQWHQRLPFASEDSCKHQCSQSGPTQPHPRFLYCLIHGHFCCQGTQNGTTSNLYDTLGMEKKNIIANLLEITFYSRLFLYRKNINLINW